MDYIEERTRLRALSRWLAMDAAACRTRAEYCGKVALSIACLANTSAADRRVGQLDDDAAVANCVADQLIEWQDVVDRAVARLIAARGEQGDGDGKKD